jgi:8-oxo-dGTP diphosphatase
MTDKREYCYPYPRPALTVDLILVNQAVSETYVLLIRRKHPPFAGTWALPGGFVDEGETLLQAAKRELKEETNLIVNDIQQVGAFAAPGRDPRGWTISVAFAGVSSTLVKPEAGDDAAEVEWHSINKLPLLAFDHLEIIQTAIKKLSHRHIINN